MNATMDPQVERYLRRLDKELRSLARDRRRELIEEIRSHIDEAKAAGAMDTEASMLNVLDRLGDPADIAAEARARFGMRPAKVGALEVFALILLPIGGLVVPVVGWIVGAILLWLSSAWTTREKLAGTLLLPGGLLAFVAFSVLATSSSAGTGSSPSTAGQGGAPVLGIVLVILLLAVPIATTVFLAVRLKRRSRLESGIA